MTNAIGDSIEIDGKVHKIKGIQRSLILLPIQVGETIGVLVANDA
jgi:ribosomal protein S19